MVRFTSISSLISVCAACTGAFGEDPSTTSSSSLSSCDDSHKNPRRWCTDGATAEPDGETVVDAGAIDGSLIDGMAESPAKVQTCADLLCQTGADCVETAGGAQCVDIDECETGTNDCKEGETCANTPLGFTCFTIGSPCIADPCGAGFDCVEIDESRRQCIDQDECSIESACWASADCINREGATEPLCQDRQQCSNGENTCEEGSETCVELDVAPGFRCDANSADAGNEDAGQVVTDAGIVEASYPKDGFCKDGDWAYCEDFDSLLSADPGALDTIGITYRAHGAGAQRFAMDCDVSSPCVPFLDNGAYHTISDDGSFGAVVLRPRQPFDFSGPAGGQLHFESNLDLTGSNRKHVIVRITSEATMDFPDVRIADVAVSNEPALELIFLGGNNDAVYGKVWKSGAMTQQFGTGYGPSYTPGQMHDIDLYVQRQHIRVEIDGQVFINQSLSDLGFDRAYVHFGHLSYNPTKDGAHPTRADNIIAWDNIAFSGPVLPENGLTPVGQQEAVFFTQFLRKWFGSEEEKSAPVECLVRGIMADGPPTVTYEHFTVWSATVEGGPALSTSDIDCYGSPIEGLEIVAQP